MAEYKREIGAAVSVAVILAILIGVIAIYSFPPSSAYGSTSVSTSPGGPSYTTTFQASTTIPIAQTFTNVTTTLDPRLAVEPLGNLTTATNATLIARALASNLGELPIQLVSQHLPTCSDNSILCTQSTYLFRTAKGANITVAMIIGGFYELDYIVQNYSSLYNDYWNNHPVGSPPTTSEDLVVANLMLKSYNLDLGQVSLNDNITGPGWAQWSQEFDGLQIANSGQVYFDVYPPNSQILRLIIIEGGGWNAIPSNFPLGVSAEAALATAKSYAQNTLHMGFIGYSAVSLEFLQAHMYYAATISDQTKTYIIFVNPITGQVGYPQS